MAAGIVTTVIVDLELEGEGRLVEVTKVQGSQALLRARVYRLYGAARDIWEVDTSSEVLELADTVFASGPAGAACVIASVGE